MDTQVIFDPYGLPPGKKDGKGTQSGFPGVMPKPGDEMSKSPKKDDMGKDDPDDDDDTPGRPGTSDNKQGGVTAPPMPGGSGKANMPGANTQQLGVPEFCLVRFVDADVLPGKTYQYAIQVRVTNPNFNKPRLVLFEALSKIPELVSDWTVTPTKTVPPDWDFYVVDQLALEPLTAKYKVKGADQRSIAGNYNAKWTAIQIHKWQEKFLDPGPVVSRDLGDWVIAERRLVFRGEPVVTKDEVAVEVPYWNESHQRFELVGAAGLQKGSKAKPLAVKLSLLPPSTDAPLVVDFVGGQSLSYPITSRSSETDTSAVEMLLMTPDGKLLARNSRIDGYGDSPRGAQRIQRWLDWRRRLFGLKGWQDPKEGPKGKG
jgi:hypothetical protein